MATLLEGVSPIQLELEQGSRSHCLREMYWAGTHKQAMTRKSVVGCGENTLVGRARDFATLLEATDLLIQPYELIVGTCMAIPEDREGIDLGDYDPHYPPGHAKILRQGLRGIAVEARSRLQKEEAPEKQDFLRAVEITYDAACRFVSRYADLARRMGLDESNPYRKRELGRIADMCTELATGAPTTFYAALQLVQFTRVFGGNGCIGRFDQWIYPFLSRDLDNRRITLEEAQELLECFFIKLNHFADINETAPRVYLNNDNLRNIALAGQSPDGQDASNELTYMCLEASAKLMLPEPKLNVRFFRDSPPQLLQETCRVLAKGTNVVAVFNDEVVVPALLRLGISLEEARDYCNDGCSELIIGGRSTIKFKVHDALPLLNEVVLAHAHCAPATFDALSPNPE